MRSSIFQNALVMKREDPASVGMDADSKGPEEKTQSISLRKWILDRPKGHAIRV